MRSKLIYLMIATAMIASGCGNSASNEEKEHEVLPLNTVEMNDAQVKAAGIELGNLEKKLMKTEIKVNGLVDVSPQNLVSVSAIMGGYVKYTSLVQGSPVVKGQVIAIIENTDFIELQQSYFEDKSKLEYAEAEYERQKDLYKESVSSAKTYQLAMSEYKTLQSSVYATEQKLKLLGIDPSKLKVEDITGSLPIYAPISGYVKKVSVNIGKYVEPTDIIAELVNISGLTLELTVFEKDVDKVSVGQKIEFNTTSKPDEMMNAVIYQVGKSINEDKAVKVYATVEEPAKHLLPGMFVNASIESDNDSVLTLPDESVISFEDKSYIFTFYETKKEGEKTVTLFKLIEVTKGVSYDGYTEVTLPDGTADLKGMIVIKGAYNLLSAMKNAGDMAC